MKSGIGEYLRSTGLDCVNVLRFNENVYVSDQGGCPTCGPFYDTEFSLDITYENSQKLQKVYHYDGNFVQFINSIT